MPTLESTVKVQPRLKQRYRNEIRDALNKEFDYANVMQIPRVVKVVVHMGLGEAPATPADERRRSRPHRRSPAEA